MHGDAFTSATRPLAWRGDWHGNAKRGQSRLAWQSRAQQGMARYSRACPGRAGPCLAWQGWQKMRAARGVQSSALLCVYLDLPPHFIGGDQRVDLAQSAIEAV